ncbi:GtrA-like protein [Roseivivax jejudonensis]|uniref:GtrA-like protein n=1 Tax=Roseivivax jejudonensis TaxID=1529041 RepID=A0A1X7A7Z4_9RHOB|nr:GtrA family protein [Roseivivax jejudonensis]SLN72510.1 GtrA-like protein [Roseivivax jejudonensis]
MPRTARLLRFGIVGAGVAALYVLLYVAFLRAGIPQGVANVAAFLIAVAVQYAGQGAFTFGRPLADPAQALRFAVMIGLGLLTSAVVTGAIGPAAGLPDWASAALVAVVLPLQNFVLMSLWVFTGGAQLRDHTQ